MGNLFRNHRSERPITKKLCSESQPHDPTDNFMIAEQQTIFTIGVYDSTEESFFGALVKNEIELFIDIRARRGMRGSKYKYVNSAALQSKLKESGKWILLHGANVTI